MSQNAVPLPVSWIHSQESRIGPGEAKRLAALLRMPGQPLPPLRATERPLGASSSRTLEPQQVASPERR